MSRCLPYARSNYEKEDPSLIGSIKSGAQNLQIQWGNIKQRKQMSSKANEKLHNKRSREEHDNLDSLKHKNKRRKTEKNIKINETFHYVRKEDADHLERSDLSEEQHSPALVLNQCNFSNGSQNINKKNAVLHSDTNNQKPGMVIRIKLGLKKHKDVEPESATSKVTQSLTDSVPCSSSQTTNPSKPPPVSTESVPDGSSELAKLSNVLTVLLESATAQSVLTESSPRSKEQPLAAASAEPCFSGSAVTDEEHRHKRSTGSSSRRLERHLYRDLIVNWKPQSIQLIEVDEDDEQNWLFSSKKAAQIAKPSVQICETVNSGSSLQPRATYLPEFGVYQMPYVIPF